MPSEQGGRVGIDRGEMPAGLVASGSDKAVGDLPFERSDREPGLDFAQQIVELTVEKETVQTNEWYGAVLVLLVLLFLLIIAILGLRLKRSRDRLADLIAAKKKEQSG